MDSIAQKASRDLEIINQTATTADAWIRQRKQPLGTWKSSAKQLPQAPRVSEIINQTAIIVDEWIRKRK
jgi:hypothetical protein